MKSAIFTPHTPERPASCAVFVSGAGSNAENLLDFVRKKSSSFQVSLLVCDNLECRAMEIGANYGVECLLFDLKKFYADHGETSTKLDTAHRREVRNLWSNMVEKELLGRGIEMVLLAGFVPLINFAELPALNVHPGDLTKCDMNGVRRYAGLHFKPVETAILDGEKFLRSSVIAVRPFTGKSTDIDSGPVLGVSAPVEVDLEGKTLAELKAIYARRTPGAKVDDQLRKIAAHNVEKLKIYGDHVVFPLAAEDFAAGSFCYEGEQLFYRGEKVVSVEYFSAETKKLI